jgi:Mrp family chromosome partitioning ATPase
MMAESLHPQADAGGDPLGIVARKVVRWIWLIALFTIIGALVAFGVSKRHSSVYQSSSQIQLNSISAAAVISGASSGSTNYVQEYALLTGSQVAGTVARQLQLSTPPAVSFSEGVVNAQTATIVADGSSPAAAARIADAYGTAYVAASQTASTTQIKAAVKALTAVVNDQTNQLSILQAKSDAIKPVPAGSTTNKYSAEIGSLQAQQQFDLQRQAQAQFGEVPGQANDAGVLVPATENGTPISPKTSRDTLLGAVIGFLIGLGLAIFMVGRDDRLRDVRAVVQHVAGLPVLASIPTAKASSSGGRLGDAEGYRTLRSAVGYSNGSGARRLQVIGIGAGTAQARVAAGLAAATARTGQPTVLLCADVRAPLLPEALGLHASPGFTSVVASGIMTAATQQEVSTERNLVFVGPGPIDDASPELLARSAARETVNRLAERGETLIINSAPLPGATDAVLLSRMVDSNILVIELGRTRAEDLSAAVTMLNRAGAMLLGVVVYGGRGGRGSPPLPPVAPVVSRQLDGNTPAPV